MQSFPWARLGQGGRGPRPIKPFGTLQPDSVERRHTQVRLSFLSCGIWVTLFHAEVPICDPVQPGVI